MKNWLTILFGGFVTYLLYKLVSKPQTPEEKAKQVIYSGGGGGGSTFIPSTTVVVSPSTSSPSAALSTGISKVVITDSAPLKGGTITPVVADPVTPKVDISTSFTPRVDISPSDGGGFVLGGGLKIPETPTLFGASSGTTSLSATTGVLKIG